MSTFGAVLDNEPVLLATLLAVENPVYGPEWMAGVAGEEMCDYRVSVLPRSAEIVLKPLCGRGFRSVKAHITVLEERAREAEHEGHGVVLRTFGRRSSGISGTHTVKGSELRRLLPLAYAIIAGNALPAIRTQGALPGRVTFFSRWPKLRDDDPTPVGWEEKPLKPVHALIEVQHHNRPYYVLWHYDTVARLMKKMKTTGVTTKLYSPASTSLGGVDRIIIRNEDLQRIGLPVWLDEQLEKGNLLGLR